MALTKTNIINLALSKLGSERLTLTDSEITANTLSHAKTVNLHYVQTLEELTRMHSWNCCKKRNQLAPFRLKLTSPLLGGTISTLLTTATTATSQPTNSTFTGYSKYDFNVGFTAAVTDDNIGATLSRTAGSAIFSDNDKWQLQYHDGSSSYTITKTTNSLDPSGTYTHAAGDFTIERVKPDFEYEYQYLIPSDAQRSFYLSNSAETYKFMKPRVDWIIEGNTILTNESTAFLCYDGVPEPSDMDSLFGQAFITLLAARMAIPITGDLKMYQFLLQEFNSVIMPEARRVNGTERLDPPTIDSEWLESTYTSNSSYSNSYPPFSQTSYGSFS